METHITSLLGFENFPFQENTNTKTIASKSRSVTAKTRALGQEGKGLGLILS